MNPCLFSLCKQSSDYCLSTVSRVCTRATIINFALPSIGPVDDEEEEVFAELEELITEGEVSKAAGWAIALGNHNLREEVLVMKESLRGTMSGRKCKNWAILLYFLKKVCCTSSILEC